MRWRVRQSVVENKICAAEGVASVLVLYIGGMVFPAGNAAAQRVIANATLIAEAGYTPILIGVGHDISSNLTTLHRIPDVAGFPTYQFRYPHSCFAWVAHLASIRALQGLLEKLGCENVYAVICYNIPAVVSLRLLRYCRKKRIRFISDCTEWYAPESGMRGLVKRCDTELRMRAAIPAGRNVICISRHLGSFFQARGCNVVVIPSLVDRRNSKWVSTDIYIPNQPRVLLYAGSPGFTGMKDRLDVVLRAVRLCALRGHSCHLHVAGITQTDYESYVAGGANDVKNLAGAVSFYGTLPHEAVLNLIRKADFTVFARDRTTATMAGFPTKLAESWACGTPVITTDTSDVYTYLKPGVNGFIADQCSVERFAEALERALSLSCAALSAMHERCRQEASLDISLYRHMLASFMISCR